MKSKLFRAAIIVIILLSSFYISIRIGHQEEASVFTLPSLPRPIAKEAVLITSAGQSTDSYIVKDIANQMMIRNYFMPQAKETDLEDISTIVFVIGYSPLGEQLHEMSYEDEKNRIKRLLEKAESKNITILAVYIGGEQRRGKNTDELLKLVCPHSDYLISLKNSNHDNLLSNLAKSNNIPLTLVKEVNDIAGPFASAFR
ncbi:MAG: DUF6305 family protein [Caulobacteraceae bacterium]